MTKFKIHNNFPCCLTLEGILSYFSEEINRKIPQWREKIIANTLNLEEIGHSTLKFGREISGLLVAAILN